MVRVLLAVMDVPSISSQLSEHEGKSVMQIGPRLTEEEFFANLRRDNSDLERVLNLVEQHDFQTAREEFAKHLKYRNHPKWFFSWREKPSSSSDLKNADREVASNAVQHRFTVIGMPHRFEGEIDWAYNPTAEPDSAYPVDHEWTWQFNRHSHWVSLGRAYRQTGNERYALEFADEMLDWIEKNPVPDEADQAPFSRWRTIEAGIRMAHTWPYALFYFLGSPNFHPQAIITMLRSMVEHASYLMHNPTAGNWLTMEMNGLYHVGALLPEYRCAQEWREYAANRLRQELEVQVYPDGAQFELTPGYHNVALSNFLGPVHLARLNNYPLPRGYLDHLEGMYAFNLWMMTPARDLPPFNDSWGVNVRETLQEGWNHFPHREDFIWVATDGKEGSPPDHTSHIFPFAGYLIQRSGWDKHARYLAFDAGPFGAGHQHEDKLSFVLSAYGKQFIVDSGSYAYDASKWRRYVLSPYGHNVVFVDGMGQNRRRNRASYITDEPVDCTWNTTGAYDYARASYGNDTERYGRQGCLPATQDRRILFVKAGPGQDFWVMCDTFTPFNADIHTYESLFHLDVSAISIDETRQRAVTEEADGPNLGIFTLSTGDMEMQVIEGQEDPYVQGWLPYKHGLTGVRPIPCLNLITKGTGRQHAIYVLYPVESGPVPDLTVNRFEDVEADQGIGVEIGFPDGCQYRIIFVSDSKNPISISGERVKEMLFTRIDVHSATKRHHHG